MTIAPLTPVVVPNLSTTFPITAAAGNAPSQMPSQQFLRTWQQQLQALTAAINTINTTVNALNAQEASIQTQVTALAKVLNGTTPFTGLNAAGTEVIPFLQNTNGTALSTAGIQNNAVTEDSLIDVTGLTPATCQIVFSNVADLQVGDYFTIGSETWTATAGTPGAFQWEIGSSEAATATNMISALQTSAVVYAGVSMGFPTHVLLTTIIGGAAANSIPTAFTTTGTAGASIGTFANGANSYIITTANTFFPLTTTNLSLNVDGAEVEINGRVNFTHNQTSTAILHVQITRIVSPTGANAYTDVIAGQVGGVNGNYIDQILYFQDNDLNGATGEVVYQLALEITANSGSGYQFTAAAILLAARNIKR